MGLATGLGLVMILVLLVTGIAIGPGFARKRPLDELARTQFRWVPV